MPLPCPNAKFVYKDKTYSPSEFREVLKNRPVQEMSKYVPNTKSIPDFPFQKTWPELLMKRMIRYASEHGYDGISWTPGEEQASRYDLSKQIDAIHYTPSEGGKYHVDAVKDGSIVASKTGTPQELEDFVGKDVTKKIVSGEGSSLRNTPSYRKLEGVDLKVGGEGMKGFYDKIVPDMVNKLGKQFGSKVGETKIEVPDHTKPDNGLPFEIQDAAGNPVDGFRTRAEAEEELDQWNNAPQGGGGFKIVEAGNSKTRRVPYFPITDSMRESVLKGQPLFSKEGPGNGQLQNQIDMNKFKDQSPEYQNRVLEALRTIAENRVPENVKSAAKYLREQEDRNAEIGGANDLLHGYVEDHMQRVWKNNNPEGKVIAAQAKDGKFATRVSFAQHRVYDSTLTGLLKSPTEMEFDPAHHTAQARAQLIKAAANKQLIDNLRDKFTRASDGRPAVVLSGSGQVVSGPNGENPKTFIDPSRVRKINIAPDVVKQLEKSGDLARYLEDGTIRDITPYVRPDNIGAAIDRLEEQAGSQNAQYDEVGNNTLRTQIMYLKSMMANKDFSGLKEFNESLDKQYAWDPQGYISLANGALKGWNFVTNSADGAPVFVKSDILVHPEFAEYLQNRLGLAPSGVASNPIGKALLGAGTKLKETLLSLSPFHMVQEALRALMVGVNPFILHGPDILSGAKIDPLDPNSPTKMYVGVRNGLNTGTNYRALQEHSEGVSSGNPGLLSKIPVIGKTLANSMNWYQDFLFKRYVPALSARGYELMFDRYREAHPDWSVDRVAKVAADHTNSTFGNIDYKKLGRSATTQDWMRLISLAPSWLESEIRSAARLFNKDEGGLGRAQVLKMTLGLWGAARVLNLVSTGNPHLEAPFGVAVKNKEGKETVFSIRTLPTDILHASTDPVGFAIGRLSPTVRAGEELISRRDQFGRKLQPEDLWADIFHQSMPIPLQAVGQAISGTGPQVGNVGQVWKGIGGTAMTYQTPAQKLAAEAAANHTESGPIDPAQMARHSAIMSFEDKIRAGEMTMPDVYKLYAEGQIHRDDLKKITDNAKRTAGMSADLASLYTRASRLPGPEYLKIYDQMNPSEKTALLPLTQQIRKRYIAKAMKDLRPEERLKDPTFVRFLNMMPDQSPF